MIDHSSPQRRTLRLGTRGSLLAMTQSRWVAAQLALRDYAVTLEVIHTTGDQITERAFSPGDGKGVFVAEIERALLEGAIDLAVHSMKDLPAKMPAGLTLAAVPEREDPRDVLVARGAPTFAALPSGALVGTSSLRRRAQLLAYRPDLHVEDLRGNIDTRLRKLESAQYDAICIAAAGLHRLGLAWRITEYLESAMMVPAVGQGALAMQTRECDEEVINLLAPLHHDATSRAVRAERAVLAALGGGCSMPLGVHATYGEPAGLSIVAVLCSLDGATIAREHLCATGDPEQVGQEVATRLIARAKTMAIAWPGHGGS